MRNPYWKSKKCLKERIGRVPEQAPTYAKNEQFSGRGFVILMLCLFTLLALRRPGTFTNPQFWAEDSVVFFREQLLYGFHAALFRPYAGYIYPVQRSIAFLAAFFPSTFAPFFYTTSALVIDSFCLALFYLPSFGHILKSDWLRFTCCILAGVAISDGEIIATAANTQWLILVAGVLLLFREDSPGESPSRWKVACRFIQGLLLGLAMPVLVVAIPFCFWKIYKERDPRCVYAIGLACSLAIQVIVFLQASPLPTSPSQDLLRVSDIAVASAISSFVFRVVLSTLIGQGRMANVAHWGGYGVGPGIAVVTAVWLTALWHSLRPLDRRNMLIAVYFALSSIGLCLVGRQLNQFANIIVFLDPFNGARYFFLSACVLIYLMAISVQAWLPRVNAQIRAALLVCIFLVGIWSNYPIPPLADLHWKFYAAAIDARRKKATISPAAAPIQIPVNPAPWILTIP